MALAAAACARPDPPVVVHDLARLAFSAERSGPFDFVAFGTPEAAGAALRGFVQPVEGSDEPFAWLRPNASLRVAGSVTAARRIVLDLAPHPAAPPSHAQVAWNGVEVARLDLARQRRRYVVDVPALAADAGPNANRLDLVFDNAARSVQPYGGPIAARLYSVASSAGDETSLDRRTARLTPQPLAIERVADQARIVQGPGTLRFTLRVPPRAELRFQPGLHPGSTGAKASLWVGLGVEPGVEHQLWRAASESLPGREVVVRLPVSAGSVVQLSFHVDAEALSARGAWTAPRVLGARALPSIRPPQHSEPDLAKADGLRRALQDAGVVLVVLDAAGAKHFGCYGHRRRPTPEIDRLASEGVLFEHAYTPAVYTLAAMSSLFTSRPPDEHGNLDPGRGRRLSSPMLAEVVAARGIHTAAFVANGMVGRAYGFERGFTEFHEVYDSPVDATEAEDFRPLLARFLAANQARRFFAWVHFREPHFPYDPKPPYDAMFGEGPIPKALRSEAALLLALDNRRRRALPAEIDHLERLYDGNLAYVDHEVGELRRSLEALGLLERTVLVIAADHGEGFWEHGHIGHEVQVYEELAHVPLIVRFPLSAGLAGRRVKTLVDLSDLAPTIADVLGLWREASGRPPFSGVSLLPVLRGAPGRSAVVTRDRGDAPRWAMRDERRTCILNSFDGTTELYDRAEDPGEKRNLASAKAFQAAECRQSLAAWVVERRFVGTGPSADAAPTASQRENLRALGYVQ